ncbi:MAG: DnaJ domain-containing protein [Sandaracinaceae bacterium]
MTRIGGKRLSEFSDRELQAELERRRQARGHTPRASRGDTPARRKPDGSLPGWKVRENLRKWFKALELDDKATLEDVEASYKRLLERYDPDRHRDDPDRFRDATKLAVALGEAYYGLQDHFKAS